MSEIEDTGQTRPLVNIAHLRWQGQPGGGTFSSGTPGSFVSVAASVWKLAAPFMRRANELAEVAVEKGVPSRGMGEMSGRKEAAD